MKKKSFTGLACITVLPLLCAFTITGCQWTPFGETKNAEGVGKEKLITEAVKKISSAASADTDIDATMRAKAQVAGVSVGVNADTDLNVQHAKADNASHAKGNIAFDLIGEKGSIDVETYSIDKDNMSYIYINESNALTGESGWIVTKKAKDQNTGNIENTASLLSLGDLIGLYSTAKDSLDGLTIKDGTISIEGKECFLVEGTLKGENVKAITDGLGFALPGVPGLPQPDLSEIDADIKMYFEKESRDPYVIELKIPEVTGKTEESPVTFGIENIDATIKFNSFDSNNEIKVPEDVEKNAVVSVDLNEIQNLIK